MVLVITREDAIAEYEKLLLNGKKVRMSTSGKGKKDIEKSKNAQEIIKYVVKEVLRWDVETAKNHFSYTIQERLQLLEIIEYIIFPKEMRGNKDEYLIELCFPYEFKFNYEVKIMELYDNILNGITKRFPREEFNDSLGLKKSAVVLRQFVSYFLPTLSDRECYEIFADTTEISKLLTDKKIFFVYEKFYNLPIEYYHESLKIVIWDDHSPDNFLFSYYCFKIQYDERIQKEVR